MKRKEEPSSVLRPSVYSASGITLDLTMIFFYDFDYDGWLYVSAWLVPDIWSNIILVIFYEVLLDDIYLLVNGTG